MHSPGRFCLFKMCSRDEDICIHAVVFYKNNLIRAMRLKLIKTQEKILAEAVTTMNFFRNKRD